MPTLFSPLVMLFQSCLTLILQIFVAFCFGSIIYWRKTIQKRLSIDFTTSICVYVVSEAVSTIACMPYTIYLIAFWHPNIVAYNAYWLLFTGAVHTLAMVCNTVTVFFLGVDRCLYVIYPLTAKKWNSFLFWLTIATMICFASIDCIFHLWDAIPETSSTECQSFGCLVSNESGQWYTMIRISVCIANLIVGILLIFFVKTKVISRKAILKTARLVLVTISLDLIFVLIPHLLSFLLLTFWGFGVTRYIGPYSLFVTTINSTFSGMVYFIVIRKTIKQSSVIHHSKASNNPAVLGVD